MPTDRSCGGAYGAGREATSVLVGSPGLLVRLSRLRSGVPGPNPGHPPSGLSFAPPQPPYVHRDEAETHCDSQQEHPEPSHNRETRGFRPHAKLEGCQVRGTVTFSLNREQEHGGTKGTIEGKAEHGGAGPDQRVGRKPRADADREAENPQSDLAGEPIPRGDGDRDVHGLTHTDPKGRGDHCQPEIALARIEDDEGHRNLPLPQATGALEHHGIRTPRDRRGNHKGHQARLGRGDGRGCASPRDAGWGVCTRHLYATSLESVKTEDCHEYLDHAT